VALAPQGQARERVAGTRAGRAVAGGGLVEGAVRGANERAAVLGEELVGPEVEGGADVRAAVDVRVVFAVVIDDESLDTAPAALDGAAAASEHGQRTAVVPLEPAGGRDRRLLRPPLRALGGGAARARGRPDRAVRADAVPPRAVQRALHGAQAARRPGEVARQRSRAALPRRADAGARSRRVDARARAHRGPAPRARRDDSLDDALHARGRG